MSLRAQLWVASDCQCPCACLGSNITPLARSRSHVEFDDPSRHNSPPVSHQRRLLVAAGGALIASPALVLAQQKFTCRIAHTEAIGTPITLAFEAWAATLREKSGGRIDAQHFPATQLGGLA